jgi:nitrite reductase/ring-hydroxylating ferredoxin subunit
VGATPAEYACPCHGARFDAASGRVAMDSQQKTIDPLRSIPVRRESDGHLYAG